MSQTSLSQTNMPPGVMLSLWEQRENPATFHPKLTFDSYGAYISLTFPLCFHCVLQCVAYTKTVLKSTEWNVVGKPPWSTWVGHKPRQVSHEQTGVAAEHLWATVIGMNLFSLLQELFLEIKPI